MADLISIQRATQSATLADLAASTSAAYLASLVSAASASIQRYCGDRDFSLTSYTEYINGGHYLTSSPLRLRQMPVISISRVATNPTAVIVIQNTSTANQRATVATTSTGLTLYRVASGVAANDSTVTWATYPTLAAVAGAVNALGNGWAATVQGSFGLYPSADINPTQGAFTTLTGGASLEMHTEDVQPWTPSYSTGFNEWGDSVGGWRLDTGTGELYGVFPRGHQNIRIDYTAGFATIPQPVQEACVALTQWMYQQSESNSSLKSAGLGAANVVYDRQANWPGQVRAMLAPFRLYDKTVGR